MRRHVRQKSVGPKVVVDNVQHYAETGTMGIVHETAQIVGITILAERCEPTYAIVAPAELTAELADGY